MLNQHNFLGIGSTSFLQEPKYKIKILILQHKALITILCPHNNYCAVKAI